MDGIRRSAQMTAIPIPTSTNLVDGGEKFARDIPAAAMCECVCVCLCVCVFTCALEINGMNIELRNVYIFNTPLEF